MQALLHCLFATALCASLSSAKAQVLNSDDRTKLFVSQRFLEEVTSLCDQRGLASSKSGHEAVKRLSETHREAIQAGESLFADILRRRGDSLERSLSATLQGTRDHLATLNADAAVGFCQDAEVQADALARKSSAEIAWNNFESELIEIEHKSGMRCNSVATRLRDSAARFLRVHEQPRDPITRAVPLDPTLLFELQTVHRAAQACILAKARAADRQISMPGSFESLLETCRQLVEALHPLTTNLDSRDAAVTRAKERVASLLASDDMNRADGEKAPR